LSVAEDVLFTGYEPCPTALMEKCSVFALSSIREGSPLVLAEALNSGCQIIATKTTGSMDILEGGRYGRIVPVRDVEALASAISAAINQPYDPGPGRRYAAMFNAEASALGYLRLFAELRPRSSV
jgi:glycosyltransferase involved in cell wall biosynthesis